MQESAKMYLCYRFKVRGLRTLVPSKPLQTETCCFQNVVNKENPVKPPYSISQKVAAPWPSLQGYSLFGPRDGLRVFTLQACFCICIGAQFRSHYLFIQMELIPLLIP